MRAKFQVSPILVSQTVELRPSAEDVLTGVRRGVSAAEGGGAMRFLWFSAGFLLGVVTTALGLLWMMTMAVVG